MNLDILSVSETRCANANYIRRKQNVNFGGYHHQCGVGVLVKKTFRENIIGFWAHKDRMILLTIKARLFNIDYSNMDKHKNK